VPSTAALARPNREYREVSIFWKTEGACHTWYSKKVWLQVLVAFRGTEMDKLKDLMTNADIRLAELGKAEGEPVRDTAVRGKPPQPSFLQRWFGSRRSGASVHSGYKRAVGSVIDEVGELVDMITGGDPSWRVCTTGHSLGGATSTVFAYLFATRRFDFSLYFPKH
jgi:hypothetical protein